MKTSNDIVLYVFLSRLTFLNSAEKINLLKHLDSSSNIALLSIEDIQKIINRDLHVKFDSSDNLNHAQYECNIMRVKGIKILYYEDAEYPALLRETVNAPFVLFYLGDSSCLLNKTVSVVGTRRITPEAKNAALNFAYDAVNDGVCVVSGLANGVDGMAHSGALNAYFDALEQNMNVEKLAKTAAVLPCGIDTVVPHSHSKLAQNILKSGGCILSEYVPGTPTEKWRYVQRNRIVAGLSPATVVVQAPSGSGALITADFALEFNRDVMFHEAAFSENAGLMEKHIKSELERDFALGKVSKRKLENSCKKYVELGAPIISGYKDYCNCLGAIPGLHKKNEQKLLFI